ncbi:hypothetical protein DAPPUDRAFT_101812 [Daphnia pulex]|uniref:Uncharacterized protein n=1 Tax=Daphnia pulex TaxID=6669 RepID=E9GEM6_DAPPU|nr:hypothetical protein DAPPUDRAFT_101812 [Daphnia pulex]|eukprot:EFX82054.1 hypothetical protein DAPPUDRAFT_101812 [Daphnia pulex]
MPTIVGMKTVKVPLTLWIGYGNLPSNDDTRRHCYARAGETATETLGEGGYKTVVTVTQDDIPPYNKGHRGTMLHKTTPFMSLDLGGIRQLGQEIKNLKFNGRKTISLEFL